MRFNFTPMFVEVRCLAPSAREFSTCDTSYRVEKENHTYVIREQVGNAFIRRGTVAAIDAYEAMGFYLYTNRS